MFRYRREIDGLRAWAVLPVLAFHAGVPALGGGFVGVDVFFVISGYLITGILLRDIARNGFSVIHFLERRARRIIPALYVVLLTCLPLGWFLMLPDELENLGQGIFATVVSCNNILLLLTSGYWDLSTELKPLLHTWSLGVEEQFYIVFPWILLALFRRSWMLAALALIGVASIILAERTSARAPASAFFLLHTRAFELLAGALLACLEFRRGGQRSQLDVRARSALVALGLGAILAGCMLFDRDTRLPGAFSLVPVGGTMLVIWFAGEAIPGSRLLCSRIMVGIGLISYSLYLWHQPLLAFMRLSSAEQPALLASVATVSLAFPLAWLSWKYVESPFRNGGAWTRRQVFAMTLLGGALIGGAGLVLDRAGGFPQRVPELGSVEERHVRETGRAAYVDRMLRLEGVPFTDDARPNALILGNSFARDFLNGVLENGYLSGHEISYYRVSWRDELSCRANIDAIPEGARAALAQADVAIFVLGAFDTDCWRDDVALYREVGAKRIIAIGTKNFGWNPNAIMVQGTEARRNFRPRVLEAAVRQNEHDRQRIVEAEFVDLLSMLVDAEGRVPLISPDGRLISEDGGHLTKSGARYVGKLLFEHPSLRDLK